MGKMSLIIIRLSTKKFWFSFAILLLIWPAFLFAQPVKIRFEHIQTVVTPYCLMQDRYGFIWFGSQYHGLFKFDGYEFQQFKHYPYEESSLSNNSVRAIAQDADGNLWVGTIDGLNKLNRATNTFQRFLHDPRCQTSPSQNYITSVFADENGVIWFGTQEGGLNKAIVLKNRSGDRDSLVCTQYLHEPLNPHSISHNNIKVIHGGSDRFKDFLLIGTAFGLNLFDKKSGNFTHFFPDLGDAASPGHNEIWSIHQDNAGEIWLGTGNGQFCRIISKSDSSIYFEKHATGFNRPIYSITSDSSGNVWMAVYDFGIFKYNKGTGQLINYAHLDGDAGSLWSNVVFSVLYDRAGILWIGRRDGIDKYEPSQEKFEFVPVPPPPGKWAMEIYSFCEDNFGSIWIGSKGRGIFKLDPENKQMTNYNHDPHDPNSLCCPCALSVCVDTFGDLWVGTTNGLDRFDTKTETFTHVRAAHSNSTSPNSLLSNFINTIYEDRSGNLWISTPRGLSKMDRVSGRFIHYLNDESNQIAQAGYCIGVIYQSPEQDSTLWIGAKGLFTFNPHTGILKKYYHEQDNPDCHISQPVYAIHEDGKGDMWVASFGGLYRLGKDKSQRHFTEKDGLPSNFTCGILEDKQGFLWISTFKGLVRYDRQTNTFRRFEMREGFLKNEFIVSSCFKSKSGKFYFGQANGFLMYRPEQIGDNPFIPPVWITGFRIFDKQVAFDTPLPDVKVIKLTHRQNFFSFDFVALNFTNSAKNTYAHILEGIDPTWIKSGSRRTASYTNVPSGKYTFRVKGANNHDVWNEEGTSVRIIISPPWWRTDIAYISYIFIFLIVLYGLRQYELRRSQMRHELTMRRFETQKLQEIDSMKSRFFANISHEFRTPLTLILGPLDNMLLKTRNENRRRELSLMQRNARRLQRLINQLLDLSKIEAGKMRLQAKEENIVALLNRIVQSFESQAKLKEIELAFSSPQDEINVYIDRDKIENIFYNLLSNALKFTPNAGEVSLNIAFSPDRLSQQTEEHRLRFIEIAVADTGVGIPTNQLTKIFDRFYQVSEGRDDSSIHAHEGTGIDLALTKELVELHHGKIEVISQENKGTTFTVYLPLGSAHLKQEEIGTANSTKFESVEDADHAADGDVLAPEPAEPLRRKKSSIILIVEDNADMRTYMRDCLRIRYRICEAVDGEDGLRRAIERIPNLIVSDVMMPKMDGFELCSRLKSDERTSHIPVILLTARASSESKIKGLELGADDYLIKPFETAELRSRVINLIEQRRKLREKFSRDIFVKPTEIAVSSYDQRFLQRVMKLIEQKLSEPDFNVIQLSDSIGMSRMQLHRKLHALTNQSASSFIRSVRLKRAADLLSQHYNNVAQIAFEVGFNNPSYFAECFRKQFGVLPSEYKMK